MRPAAPITPSLISPIAWSSRTGLAWHIANECRLEKAYRCAVVDRLWALIGPPERPAYHLAPLVGVTPSFRPHPLARFEILIVSAQMSGTLQEDVLQFAA